MREEGGRGALGLDLERTRARERRRGRDEGLEEGVSIGGRQEQV